MKFSITQLAGEIPVVPDHLIPDQHASSTLNARQEGGSLVPIRENTAGGYSAPGPSVNSWSIYPFDKTKVLTRSDNADFIRGPLANDSWDRVYSAGDGLAPQLSYSSGGVLSTVNLGIDPPPTPTISSVWNTAEPTNPDSQVIRCAYYVTNVTARGEESEPSDTTQIINRWDGASIPINLGTNTDSRAATRRIYRSEGGGVFNFVAEIASSAATVNDTVYSESLGEPCDSETWNAPPSNLSGLTMVGNGFFAGFFDNTLCFCEPYQPHAWPLDYQLAFPDTIVGLAMAGGVLIVTTTGNPWFVSGAHPGAMSQTRLDVRAGNLSRRGLVDMGDYALYPTNEGLMMASASGMQLVSQNFYSRQQWLALDPASFKAFRYRGQYLCFASTGAFIFNLENGVFPLEPTGDPADTVLAGHYQSDEDKLYLLIGHSNGTRSVVKFDDGENRVMTWESREFVMSKPVVLSCARVDADGAVDFSVNGDNYDFSRTVENDSGFRLPSGKPKRMKVSVACSERINVITLASSMSELL